MSRAATIYLDHNATTMPRPEVVEAMTAALRAPAWGNPSSVHALGRQARNAVEQARASVSALIGATPEEVVFTSGGTEGNNLAIRGLALAERQRRAAARGETDARAVPARIVSSALEHPSVSGALTELAREGFAVDRVPVSSEGTIDPAMLAQKLDEETVLVTLAAVNHEIGNLYPVQELAAVARAKGACFHTDCVQAAGRIPVDLGRWGVDAATLSAHKLHGPKGVGAVFVRQGLFPHPLVAGGHQERERRGGTENVAGIVGFGVACALGAAPISFGDRVALLRDQLEARLLAIPGARLHGSPTQRAPGTTNIGFAGARGDLVVIGLDLEGVCVSTGAACTSGSLEPSPAILALGLDATRAREAVRFSLGWENTQDEIERAAALTERVVARVRQAAA